MSDTIITRLIRAGITGILIAVPLIYSSMLQDCFNLPKRVFFQCAVAILLLLFAVQIILDPSRLTARVTRLDPFLAGWLAWNALTCLTSLDRTESLHTLIYTACLVALFFLITRTVATKRQALLLFGVVLALGVIEAAYGIIQRGGITLLYEGNIYGDIPFAQEEAWRGLVLGTFGNANHLASYLALTAPALLGLLIFARGIWFPVTIVSMIITTSCLALTGARTAWFAAAAGFAVIIRCSFRYGRRGGINLSIFLFCLIIALLTLLLLVEPELISDLWRRLQALITFSGGSQSYRVLTWRVTFEMIKDRPFLGGGPGTFKLLFLPALGNFLSGRDPLSYWHLNEKMNEAHNEYLHTAAETGLPGLVILIGMIMVILLVRTRRLTTNSPSRGFLSAALSGGITAVLVDACGSIPFHVVPTWVAFWTMTGLLFSLTPSPVHVPPRAGKPGPAGRLTAAGAMVLLAVSAWYPGVKEVRANYHLKQGTVANGRGDYGGALRSFNRALRLTPSSGRIRFYLGSTLARIGRYDEAAVLLRESAKNFQDIYLYKNLAVAYEGMGKREKAVEAYRRWRNMGLKSHEANNLIALIRLQQGKTGEAEKRFRDTLRVRPWDWTAHTALGRLLLDTGRLQEAIEVLEPDLFRENPESYTLYGMALLKAEHYEEAMKNFLIALEENPRSVTARNNLAALYNEIGEIHNAVREWKRVLAIDPANKVARANLENIGVKP